MTFYPSPGVTPIENSWNPTYFDFLSHLHHQSAWSEATFGPAKGVDGVIDHIEQELEEIKKQPYDLEEWIDVVILALDGAWRAGYTPEQIIEKLVYKQTKNESRKWPDWRTSEPGKAINHIKEETPNDQ